jgi:hypothetical protein
VPSSALRSADGSFPLRRRHDLADRVNDTFLSKMKRLGLVTLEIAPNSCTCSCRASLICFANKAWRRTNAYSSGLSHNICNRRWRSWSNSTFAQDQPSPKEMGFEQGDPAGDKDPVFYDPDYVSELLSTATIQFQIPDPTGMSRRPIMSTGSWGSLGSFGVFFGRRVVWLLRSAGLGIAVNQRVLSIISNCLLGW